MKYSHYLIPGDYTDITVYVREGNRDDFAVIREIFNLNIYRFEPYFLEQKESVILDIGANIGAFSLYALNVANRTGKVVHIYAVEPEEHNLEILRKNIISNPDLFKSGSTVTVIQKGLASFSGTAKITNNAGSSRLTNDTSAQDIDVITFKELLKEINRDKIDFIKYDIEGSEVPMITSASLVDLLKARRYAIEFDEQNSTDDFVEIIKPFLGYFSFSTFGVPSRGCNIYLENHK